MTAVSGTHSLHGSADDTALAPGTPLVFRLLSCERPLAGTSCHALDGIDTVAIGRAAAASVRREPGALALGVPDRAMSTAHARLVRDGRRWVIEDAGSRNGVVLNGEREDRAHLVDGDVFELGETLWLFRDRGGPRRRDLPPDLDERALPEPLPGLRTFSPALHEAFEALARIVHVRVPVLLQAESGTGKELCARAIHERSRRPGAFIAVNCGALPETIATSELFGVRRGAFSGATEDRGGLIRGAHDGTLFLDEIADLPLASQALLLRVLQEREVTPIGATQPVPVDLQVVAASHRDLKVLVRQELFRHDLYARLAGFTVRLAPLRERREDLGLLVATLLARSPFGATAQLTANAARALVTYDWPLNVRELESCLVVASTLADGGTIRRRHLPETLREPAAAAPDDAAGPSDDDQQRRAELVALLREHQGNITAIARATGWNRVQIHRWLKRFELDPRPFRGR
jgi:sigma-54 dependent transcriptional regulator, acetoin dehydrogenase operon transcriptional activator AcoR